MGTLTLTIHGLPGGLVLMLKMEKMKRWIAFILLMVAVMGIVIGLPFVLNPQTGKIDFYGLQNQSCAGNQLIRGFNDSNIMCTQYVENDTEWTRNFTGAGQGNNGINITVNNSDKLDGKHYDDNWNSTRNITYEAINTSSNLVAVLGALLNNTNNSYIQINNNSILIIGQTNRMVLSVFNITNFNSSINYLINLNGTLNDTYASPYNENKTELWCGNITGNTVCLNFTSAAINIGDNRYQNASINDTSNAIAQTLAIASYNLSINFTDRTMIIGNKTYALLGAENQTKPHCSNITGAASNLCTITGAGGETDPIWQGNSSLVLNNITRWNKFDITNASKNWTLDAQVGANASIQQMTSNESSTYNSTYHSAYLNGTVNQTLNALNEMGNSRNRTTLSYLNITGVISGWWNRNFSADTFTELGNAQNRTILHWLNITSKPNATSIIDGLMSYLNYTSLTTAYVHSQATSGTIHGLTWTNVVTSVTPTGIIASIASNVLTLTVQNYFNQQLNTTNTVSFGGINNTGAQNITGQTNMSNTLVYGQLTVQNNTALKANLSWNGRGCKYDNGTGMVSEYPCTQ